ncbi:hypothetical protein NPIL_44501 [Nephila pilipes]|uniref:Uncharacterized protein n=1 Tax=Nephila pilipes TaxID=299642 RepID=A0A8X6IP56_NEPPI|nr:hypothetical protein NPIL_44501 [Nephila pilipes]
MEPASGTEMAISRLLWDLQSCATSQNVRKEWQSSMASHFENQSHKMDHRAPKAPKRLDPEPMANSGTSDMSHDWSLKMLSNASRHEVFASVERSLRGGPS